MERIIWFPMAVEEPSVVAAASHIAKLARTSGGFQAVSDRPIMRGQIQVMDLEDLYASQKQKFWSIKMNSF